MIAQLLCYSRTETTARYAHLARDLVCEAAVRVAASIGEYPPSVMDDGDVSQTSGRLSPIELQSSDFGAYVLMCPGRWPITTCRVVSSQVKYTRRQCLGSRVLVLFFRWRSSMSLRPSQSIEKSSRALPTRSLLMLFVSCSRSSRSSSSKASRSALPPPPVFIRQ